VGKKDMEKAVYNWLRGCGGFSEVTLSFAKEPEKWTGNPVKTMSFDTRESRPVWERTPQGRKDLAKDLATIINDTSRRLVYLLVKADGIYVGEDKIGNFKPRVTVSEENHAQYPSKQLGDKVTTDDWEPYISFVATSRSRYTNYSPKEASH
jgi:hypothetical protein